MINSGALDMELMQIKMERAIVSDWEIKLFMLVYEFAKVHALQIYIR